VVQALFQEIGLRIIPHCPILFALAERFVVRLARYNTLAERFVVRLARYNTLAKQFVVLFFDFFLLAERFDWLLFQSDRLSKRFYLHFTSFVPLKLGLDLFISVFYTVAGRFAASWAPPDGVGWLSGGFRLLSARKEERSFARQLQ